MREILEEGATVRYTGEYENCHGADYVVTRVFTVMGVWYDLKLKNEWVPGGAYAEIYSAPGHQVLGIKRS